MFCYFAHSLYTAKYTVVPLCLSNQCRVYRVSHLSQPAATRVIFQVSLDARSELLHVATLRVAQRRPEGSPGKPHGSGESVVGTIAGVDPNHFGADRQALDQRRTPIASSGRNAGRSPVNADAPESNAIIRKHSSSSHSFMVGEDKGIFWRAEERRAPQRELSFGWDGAVVVGGGGKGGEHYQSPVAVASQPVRYAEEKSLGRSRDLGEARRDPAPPPSHEVLAWLR